jgi:hypothetical protein
MSSENSDMGTNIALSLVAQFDDINRLNGVLNDGAAEECKFIFFINSPTSIFQHLRLRKVYICKSNYPLYYTLYL